MPFSTRRCAPSAAVGGMFLLGLVVPQLMAQRSRLSGPIKSRARVVLVGHTRPQVKPENDDGPSGDTLVLQDMAMVLRPSAAQQTELDQLLREQQDPSAGNYHHWISPEEYAARFGASA